MNRLLGLFEAVAHEPDGISLARLAVVLASPKSSLLTLLRPLVAQGYLTHKAGKYSLGSETYRFATTILMTRKFSSLMRPIMEDLMKASGETVILATLDRSAGVIIYQDVIESVQSIRYVVPAGEARALYASAGGRLMLAYQDEAWREAYLTRTELVPLTDRTLTDVDELRKLVLDIRKTGYSFSAGHAVSGAAGVAAPIFDADGTIIAALLLGAPEARGQDNKDELIRLTTLAAARASRSMGYSEELTAK
ncbi:IclR family transcriptional regulator [Rhizobium sp. C4]|uniref:IclR family transcriptional regulator n=1 Tax=Rhizobium sp. C4 TaxID=1349800 RepID=UPI001E4CE463|nr:IclR family transcriptional regulator [Rhizobium sp. C4]MCD2172262.1 IclR family transcriptional regulator [Rhizobium sp. C4]